MGDVTSAPLAALGVDVGTTNTKVVLAVFGDHTREERSLTVPTPGSGAGLQAVVLGAMREVVLDSPGYTSTSRCSEIFEKKVETKK